MLEQIIKNEIRLEIGREPNEKEFQVFMDYIEATYSDMERDGKRKMDVTDLNLAIHDCCKDCFVACDECGDLFLPDSDEWNTYAHCCRECKPYQDPDMMPGGHDYY